MNRSKYFFCGIGGSGMLPLALIVRATGAQVAGSDRSLDQGRLSAKFDYLARQGIGLYRQDGSGVTSPDQLLVTSAAIEETVPDVVAATRVGAERMTRPQLLAQLFNDAPLGIACGGTSGKSTTTGMIGWIMKEAGRDPTVMNGAVMKNFADADAPFASALVGGGDVFVSEVDESDGSIALYRPAVAVLGNITLDHKSLDELRALFRGFASASGKVVLNLDDAETRALAAEVPQDKRLTFSLKGPADFVASAIEEAPFAVRFTVTHDGVSVPVQLQVPGRHNVENALAAIAAAHAAGVDLATAAEALSGFKGLRRRFELVGTANDIAVIDDFAHNPDKLAATLATLHAFPGRLLVMFQPHGYGPLRVMGSALVDTFVQHLGEHDVLILPDPVYHGGTADRSVGSAEIVRQVTAGGRHAEHIAERAEAGERLLALARPGDRILICGARDDTLSLFAADLAARL